MSRTRKPHEDRYADLLVQVQEACAARGLNFRRVVMGLARGWLSANPLPGEGDNVFQDKLRSKLVALFGLGQHSVDPNGDQSMTYADRDAANVIADEVVAAFARPKVGVGVIVFRPAADRTLEMLLLRRGPACLAGAGTWSPPGGWMEHGETWEDTALRELSEEVGLTAESARFLTAVPTLPCPATAGEHLVIGYCVVRGWKLGGVPPADARPRRADGDDAGGPYLAEGPEKADAIGWFPVRDLVGGRAGLTLFAPFAAFVHSTVLGLDLSSPMAYPVFHFAAAELAGRA